MRRAMIVGFVVVLSAGSSFAGNQSSVYGPEGLDELTKQKGLFKTTLINPDAGFSSYSKLCPKRVLLQFRGPGPAQNESTTGSMVRKKSRSVAIPEGEDLETFRQIVTDAFVGEMGSCELFELVEEVDPATLYVRVTVMDIVTDVVSKSSKSGKKPKPFSAQGTIVFDLIDAETGIIQARFGESRKSKKADASVAPPEAGAQWVNIWSWAQQATVEFRQELERVFREDRG